MTEQTHRSFERAAENARTSANPEASRATCSVTEAGWILGISRGLAYQGVRDGSIPAFRVGNRWIVPNAALKALLGQSVTNINQNVDEQSGHE